MDLTKPGFDFSSSNVKAKYERKKLGSNDFVTSFYTSMLYPKEDPRHQAFILWAYKNYRCCWITHAEHMDDEYDEDGNVVIDDETGQPKQKLYKEHCHFVWGIPNKCKISTMRAEMRGSGFLVQGVRSIDSYMRYMVHKTYDCKLKGKPEYSWKDIKVNSDYFRDRIRQNEKQVQSYYLYMMDGIVTWLGSQRPSNITFDGLIHHFWQDRAFIYDNLSRVNTIVRSYQIYGGESYSWNGVFSPFSHESLKAVESSMYRVDDSQVLEEVFCVPDRCSVNAV